MTAAPKLRPLSRRHAAVQITMLPDDAEPLDPLAHTTDPREQVRALARAIVRVAQDLTDTRPGDPEVHTLADDLDEYASALVRTAAGLREEVAA